MKSEFIKKAYSNSEYTPEQIEELKKCFHDPIYFMKTYVKVMHPKKGVVPFELYEYQEEMIDVIHNNKDVLLMASRQLGKTTVAAIYILWMATFQEDKLCVIASKAMAHATEIMGRIKFSYEELPNWLKAGCKFYNRTSIEFDNGSIIKSEATTEKTGRGGSPSCVDGNTLITLRNKTTGEIIKIPIQEAFEKMNASSSINNNDTLKFIKGDINNEEQNITIYRTDKIFKMVF